MHPKDAAGIANSVAPDQTAPLGAVWSGSALFAQTNMSKNLGKLLVFWKSEIPIHELNSRIVLTNPCTNYSLPSLNLRQTTHFGVTQLIELKRHLKQQYNFNSSNFTFCIQTQVLYDSKWPQFVVFMLPDTFIVIWMEKYTRIPQNWLPLFK